MQAAQISPSRAYILLCPPTAKRARHVCRELDDDDDVNRADLGKRMVCTER